MAAVSRKASRPLSLMRPQHDPDDQSRGDCEYQTHRRGSYRARPSPVASSATISPTAAAGSGSSAAARTRRVPTITPSAPRRPPRRRARGWRSRSRRATGALASRLGVGDQPGGAVLQAVALAGGADHRDRVHEPLRGGRDLLQAVRRRGGRHQRHQREPEALARLRHLGRGAVGQVGDDQPRGAAALQALDERARAPGAKTMFA